MGAPAESMEKVELLQRTFPAEEVASHLEVISFGGQPGFANLPKLDKANTNKSTLLA